MGSLISHILILDSWRDDDAQVGTPTEVQQVKTMLKTKTGDFAHIHHTRITRLEHDETFQGIDEQGFYARLIRDKETVIEPFSPEGEEQWNNHS